MATHGKRRALGQHFLADRSAAQLIAQTAVNAAREHGCQALLEIGPGKGAITEPLVELLKDSPHIEFILSEKDAGLVNHWMLRSHELPREIRIEEGDFMHLPEEKFYARRPLAVASNLPYSAGTAIVTRLAELKEIPVMVLMFQAEVAQRLRAEPDSRAWGSLSVWIQNHWDVRKLLAVPPKAFRPPPEVDSEVVVLTRRAAPRIDVGADEASQQLWQTLLKTAFAHRRKMLRSGLPGSGPWRAALAASAIDPTKRAEALTWEEWERLYTELKAQRE